MHSAYLTQTLKTHRGPLNAGKDEVVPVGDEEEQSLLSVSVSISRSSPVVGNIVHL